jgi:hypothetical protein
MPFAPLSSDFQYIGRPGSDGGESVVSPNISAREEMHDQASMQWKRVNEKLKKVSYAFTPPDILAFL